jgi:hypothetical protein
MQVTARREPRLQTGHLLTWVVGCAVGFAAYRSIAPPRHFLSSRGLAIVTGYGFAMGMVFGTILTGCGLIAYRRWKGDASYPSRAGHWLLILGLAVAAADVAATVAFEHQAARDPSMHVTPYLAQFQPGPEGFWPVLYHHAVGWVMGAIIALGFLLALRGRLERRWLAVFLVFFLVSATLAAVHVASAILAHFGARTRPWNLMLVHVYAGAVVLGALAIVAAIAGDRRSGALGDGLHRLGVGAWLTIAAIQTVIYTLYLGLQ